MTSESTETRSRPYRKRARAEQEERTRERITEAAVKLHGTVGPARTTISAIAQEAGVQRATVYRHFPNEAAIFDACSAHYEAAHPYPDIAAWKDVRDPGERLRTALSELYRFYAENEAMLEKVTRDAPLVPSMERPLIRAIVYLQAAGDAILRGRPERGHARRRAAATIRHAIAFTTWQSLVRAQGLSLDDAVAVMVAAVESAGRASRA